MKGENLDSDTIIEMVDMLGFEVIIIKASEIKHATITCEVRFRLNRRLNSGFPAIKAKGLLTCNIEEEDLVYLKFDPEFTSPRILSYLIEDQFKCSVKLHQDVTNSTDLVEKQKVHMEAWVKEFALSLFFSLPIFVLTMVVTMIVDVRLLAEEKCFGNLPWFNLVVWALASPVQFYFGKRFYKGAYKAVKNWSTNMDVLIVLGTSSAYIYGSTMNLMLLLSLSGNSSSAMSQIEPSHSFETSSLLISIVLLGKYLEAKSKHRTTDAITNLAKLKISDAICLEGGIERKTDIDLLDPGCTVKVYPGSSIPADGHVVDGEGWVNESMMTGEGNLVKKTKDAYVFGGTICCKGSITVKISKVGKNTALSQIISLVENAQSTKPPIQAYADKISGIFVPLVMIFAILTWLVWFSLIYSDNEWVNGVIEEKKQSRFIFGFNFGISVLVIACPCALGLATPTAVMVATGVAARFGILIKGGEVLEAASHIKTIVFDKTGTLTQGKLRVKNLVCFTDYYSEEEIKSFIVSVESQSEHLIAKAITAFIQEPPFPCLKFQNLEGQGVSGLIRWKSRDLQVLIGNETIMKSHKIEIPKEIREKYSDLENEGKTTVLVSISQKIVSIVAVSESELAKPEAPSVISALQEQGYSVWIITGDNRPSAIKIANYLKIPDDQVIANCYPGDKRAKVEYLQGALKCASTQNSSLNLTESTVLVTHIRTGGVMFVGDGINDSPSLAQADIGIAIGGTDIANDAAGVVLLKNDLRDVLTTLDIGSKALSKIKWNFFWAFIYNICGIPLASGALYPWISVNITSEMAAAAMACSSTAVVLSSLLLNRYTPRLLVN